MKLICIFALELLLRRLTYYNITVMKTYAILVLMLLMSAKVVAQEDSLKNNFTLGTHMDVSVSLPTTSAQDCRLTLY